VKRYVIYRGVNRPKAGEMFSTLCRQLGPKTPDFGPFSKAEKAKVDRH